MPAGSSRQGHLFGEDQPALPEGALLLRGFARPCEQALLESVFAVLDAAPPYHLRVKTGAQMINRITNCGAYGWHSDARGYRYVAHHPETGLAWPPIPSLVATMAREAAARSGATADFAPDACLVNLYEAEGRLSLHQDRDEADFAQPIVSFSFGNDALFVIGGHERKGATQTILLRHGDVMVLHGAARLRFHGVKAIVTDTAPVDHPAIPANGRLNLTLRRAK